jgi:DNA-directed RNA polymerase subunit beta
MTIHRYFLSDFVEIQRISFFKLLEKGLIEEFSKRNPITNTKKDIELFFYPRYYKLTPPQYSAREALLKSKSYSSRLYLPVQLTDKISRSVKLKWVYVGNLPLMTKRGHFILNGTARVVVNQMIRSPGIYYQAKTYEIYATKWSSKPETTYKRYYADLIGERGAWLRLEVDKEKLMWAQLKKGPKMPVLWLLIGMGLTDKVIFKSVIDANRLLLNFEGTEKRDPCDYVKTPPEAWSEISNLFSPTSARAKKNKDSDALQKTASELGRTWLFNKFMNPRTYDLGKQGRLSINKKLGLSVNENQCTLTAQDLLFATDYLIKVEKGLNNVDDIDHLKNRRVRTSGELLQIQLGTALVRLEKIIRDKINKISSELIFKTNSASSFDTVGDLVTPALLTAPSQEGFSSLSDSDLPSFSVGTVLPIPIPIPNRTVNSNVSETFRSPTLPSAFSGFRRTGNESIGFSSESKLQPVGVHDHSSGIGDAGARARARARARAAAGTGVGVGRDSLVLDKKDIIEKLTISDLINTKAFNGTMREFFGSSPLSQFMDQINPLAELTHKRRLSSMGPGGVTRDNATLAIRGIHPTHYGRICPVETPEGKNTGLVNSITTYGRVNPQGLIETPFYKVFKGQVQKKTGMFFLSAEQEEKVKLAAADLYVSNIGFLPKSKIPVRIGEEFTKITREDVQYIGVSPVQMISIATSLIPFLEHDDANRALMGSNMQRQSVPLLRPERPLVGTGLEARAVSDSGHVVQATYSGFICYVSAQKIIILSALPLPSPI